MAKKRVEGDGGFNHHYPRLVAILTCHAQGRDNAMAVAWHTSISVKPPLIGISLSPKRFSYKLILEAGEFGINFLPLEKAELIASVGGSKGSEVDKFQVFGIKKESPLKTSVPILEDAYAAYECKLVDHRTYGDHELVVGEIIATHFLEEAITEKGIIDFEKVAPALYLSAELYATTAKESIKHLDRNVYGKV